MLLSLTAPRLGEGRQRKESLKHRSQGTPRHLWWANSQAMQARARVPVKCLVAGLVVVQCLLGREAMAVPPSYDGGKEDLACLMCA